MIDAEIVTQNHLDGFEMQCLVSHIDVRKIDHSNILHDFLMIAADFEIGEIRDQDFKVHAANSRVYPLIFFHLPVWEQLVDKRLVHTTVRCTRV